MSSRYKGDGRRKSSMTHATYHHRCPGCDKVNYGNGGKSSHERNCRDARFVRLATLEELIEFNDRRHTDLGDEFADRYRVEREVLYSKLGMWDGMDAPKVCLTHRNGKLLVEPLYPSQVDAE